MAVYRLVLVRVTSPDSICVITTFHELVISAYKSDLGEGRFITQGFYHLLIGVASLLRRSNDSKSVRSRDRFIYKQGKNLSNNHLISLLLRSLLILAGALTAARVI